MSHYNPAEFGRAFNDAIERSGQPIEFIRSEFTGGATRGKKVTRFNNVLAGQPVSDPLTQGEVDLLLDATGVEWQAPDGTAYTPQQIYGLAGALPPGTSCPID